MKTTLYLYTVLDVNFLKYYRFLMILPLSVILLSLISSY